MSYFWTNISIDRDDLIMIGYQDGKRFKNRIPIHPHLYVDDTTGAGKYRTVGGKVVKRIDFEHLKQIMRYRDKYQDVHGFNMYGLQTARSWHYIYYNYLQEHWPDEVKYDASLINVAVIDIEVAADEGFPSVEYATKPITAISLQSGNIVATFGCEDFVSKNSNHIYFKRKDEKDLLEEFVKVWSKMNIDVVTGWNVENFDIPYVINRMNRLFGQIQQQPRQSYSNVAKRLSPWGLLDKNSRLGAMTSREGWDIIGINCIDYLAAYKKFTYTQQESYSLDNISHVELGERKLDYSEYDGLMGLYKNNFQKFIEYNIKDVDLVKRLDDKMKLLELMYAIAYDAKVNINDAFTSVRLWDVMIHNYLIKKNIVVPKVSDTKKERQNVGGYVKDPIKGFQKWVVSFDLNSLYPHLIMQYNISPETYKGIHSQKTSVEDIVGGAYNNIDNPDDCTICGSGAMYTKDFKGFLPTLMERTYNDRLVWKNKMIKARKQYEKTPSKELEYEIAKCNNMQLAKKIQLNSAYGALANPYFRWFKLEHAEAITMSGQLSIRWIEKHMNKYLNDALQTKEIDYVVAIDTDSMYITLDGLVNKEFQERDNPSKDTIISFLDTVVQEKLEPLIDSCYQILAENVNAFDQKMIMKREVIADAAVWTAKKHYVLNVYDDEGVRYKKPRLKVMGIESVRSSTPATCRQAINSLLRVMLNENEDAFINFVEDFKSKFYKMSFEDIAFPRGINSDYGLTKYEDPRDPMGPYRIAKKGTPIHVRGAIVFNNKIMELDIENKYTRIHNGDKIKFCYLKLPNPVRDNVISILNTLPKQLGLDKYIDYNKQFEKAFLEPMKTIAESIGWRTEKRLTLEDFWK